MKHSLKTGFSFGSTSGIITTLGLMVGLHAGTRSKLAVMGGILTIAIADAFSDALGIHISEESENKHTTKEIWESTAATFLSKFVFAITFLVPVLWLELPTAIVVSVAWGLSLLGCDCGQCGLGAVFIGIVQFLHRQSAARKSLADHRGTSDHCVGRYRDHTLCRRLDQVWIWVEGATKDLQSLEGFGSLSLLFQNSSAILPCDKPHGSVTEVEPVPRIVTYPSRRGLQVRST
jgi:hypothetical protein